MAKIDQICDGNAKSNILNYKGNEIAKFSKINEGKELDGYNWLQNDRKLLKSENFVKKK